MKLQSLFRSILVSVAALVVISTGCAVSAQTRHRQTSSALKAQTNPTTPSLKKYFPQRVGKFVLVTADMSDEETQSMKSAWVSLGATDFARGIYQIPNPNVQDMSQLLEGSALLTVASFPPSKTANSMLESLATLLGTRGYTVERKILNKRNVKGLKVRIIVASSPNLNDWAVIWSSGSVLFQVQSPKKKEDAIDFAQSFPN
jgi:hypothetical protein